MVQQISALIVQPAVDATKYTAGAQEKIAADKAMAASSREAGAAQQGLAVVLTDTSAKITTTGDVVTRLERTYVAGAKQALMFERDLNALNRAIETGKTDIADAANILVGMNQKLGLSADSSSIAASGQTKLAAAINIANDRIRQQTTLLNEVAIAEARAAQNAENRRQSAAANQNRFNQVLGVGGSSSNASASAGVFQAEFDRLEQIATLRAQQIGGVFRDELNSSFGIGSSGKSANASASVFEHAARESEMYEQKARDLRAALGDVSIMQDRLNAELAEYAVLAERGLITSEQLGKAQQMARARGAGPSAGAQRAAGFNAGQQLQDIFVTSAMGMPISSIAFGQGPQLASAIQQGGGIGALKDGLMALVSPTTLVTIGLTAAAAAAVKFGMNVGGANPEVEKFHDWLSKIGTDANTTADFLAKVNAEIAKMPTNIQVTQFARGGSAFLDQQKRELNNPLAEAAGYEGNISAPKFVETYNLIDKVLGQLRTEDFGTLEDLYRKLDDIVALRPDLQKFAETWLSVGENILKTREALDRADLRAHGMGAYQPRDGKAMTDWMAGNAGSIYQMQRQQDVALMRLRARSPQEQADAARAAARLEAVPGEGSDVSRQREENAAALAYAQAMKEITDAQDARKRSMDAALASQQHELDLIGKTGGEQAKLRYEFERMQELREQAARTGTPIDQKEVANIKAAAEAMGQYADALARAKLGDDLSFESDQLRRTTQDQQIAARLRGAGLPVDINGQFAQQMRGNQYYSDARDVSSGFVKTLGQELIDSGGDIGKSFAKAFQNALLDATSKAWERLADQIGIAFANWLTGSSGAGVGGGGAFGTASGFADMLFGGASNDNFAAPAGKVTRAPLPDIGSFVGAGFTKTGIPLSKIGAQGLGAKVNAAYADRFQGLLNDLTAAGYPITSLGEGGYSYRNVAGSSHLSNHAFGNAIDINPRQNPWAVGAKGNFAQYGIDPNELAQKNGLFWGGNWNKSDAMHFQVDKSVQSLDKLATGSTQAAGRLDDFGKGLQAGLGDLGKGLEGFGQNLSSFLQSAQGGGSSWFKGLSSMFGGIGGAFGHMMSISPAATMDIISAGGGFTGLFADGTENAPPGWAWVGERGPELRKLRAGDVIRSNPRSRQMVADNNNGGGMPAFSPVFNIDARGSTMSRGEYEQIARQQSNAALAEYQNNQKRGGFGSLQKRYTAQKN